MAQDDENGSPLAADSNAVADEDETLNEPLLVRRTRLLPRPLRLLCDHFTSSRNQDDDEVQQLSPQSREDDSIVGEAAAANGGEPYLVLTLLGHPYVRYSVAGSFLRQILLAVTLGAVVGILSAVLIGGMEQATASLQWLVLKSSNLLDSSSHFSSTVLRLVGRVSITVVGALLAGAILWYSEWKPERSMKLIVLGAPGDTATAASPPQPSDDDDLHDEILKASLTAMASSGVALAFSFPLGPELVLLALARALATLVVDLPYRWCLTPVDLRPTNETRPYQQQLWMPAALAATLGSVLPVHAAVVLGPLLGLELGTKHRFFVPNYNHQQQSIRSDLSQRPEFMEVVTLQVVAAMASSLFSQWVSLLVFPPTVAPKNYVTMDYHFQVWHLQLAVALGILCGVLGSAVWNLQSGLDRLKTSLSGSPPSVFGIFCAMLLAGLIQGSILMMGPDVAGSGLSLLQDAFSSETNDASSLVINDSLMATSRQKWLLIALCRFVGLGMSLGIGLLGSPLIPMASVGLCVGLAMGYSVDDLGQTSWLPVTVTVPCCVAACVVSLCPIPLTTCFALILVFGCAVEQAGPILLASLLAWGVTGGWGSLRNTEERRLGLPLTGTIVDGNHVESLHEEAATDEDEILRNIRSTIFGNV